MHSTQMSIVKRVKQTHNDKHNTMAADLYAPKKSWRRYSNSGRSENLNARRWAALCMVPRLAV